MSEDLGLPAAVWFYVDAFVAKAHKEILWIAADNIVN